MLKIVVFPFDRTTAIEYWTQKHEIGEITVAQTKHGVCYIGFETHTNITKELRARFPLAPIQRTNNSVELCKIDTLHIKGTPFQISVWKELLKIESGSISTYSEIAQAIGSPRAVRAVGSAIGRNPISILIPCHRVVRSDGKIGGYYWGEKIKEQLLTNEQIL